MKNPIDRLFDLALMLSIISEGTSDEAAAAAVRLAKKEAWDIAQALDNMQSNPACEDGRWKVDED